MEWQRHQYTSFPWNEKLQKKLKRQRGQLIFFQIFNDLFFFLLGVFATVIVLSYYPFPWS